MREVKSEWKLKERKKIDKKEGMGDVGIVK